MNYHTKYAEKRGIETKNIRKENMMDKKILKKIETAQKNEITEYFIYLKLSESVKNQHNKEILKRISDEELGHYHYWKKQTQKEIVPNRWEVWKYYWISKIFGITFGIKLMENAEKNAQTFYQEIVRVIPEIQKIIDDEEKHEKEIIGLIEEEKLKYIGSIVLGLNDALVELTGTLAGLTLALQNNRLIAVAGLVTGIAAALSMAASEYLSQKHETTEENNPLKASIYTGIAYIFTVLFLILPYFIFSNYFISLGATIFNAILIIFFFNFYIAVAKGLSFKKRFLEMALISLAVSAISFFIGYILKIVIGISI